jgi:hypothetical protein
MGSIPNGVVGISRNLNTCLILLSEPGMGFICSIYIISWGSLLPKQGADGSGVQIKLEARMAGTPSKSEQAPQAWVDIAVQR